MKADSISKYITPTKLLAVSALFLFQSLGAATITGRVTDASTGDFLPGANVVLEGTTRGAASDRAGEYRIANVPEGSYTLVATYVGYDDFTVDINVTSDAVTQDIPLQPAYVELGEVTVEGLRQGQIKALNQQKTAANIKNVVAREQMERFPDLNTAEVLQRVPAVSIARDQGEGRYVLLRGTEARLNAISVNGERIASPETEERFVGLDVISANQLASIEVTKAITPDMDGDAIGGAVNLVTRSALDYDKRLIKATAGGGYGNLMGEPLLQGEFTFADRFGPDKNIGITFSTNYYQSNRGSDNSELEWGGEDDTSGNEIDWALQTWEARDYVVRRDRFGLASNIDYRLNADNQFFIHAMWNRRNDFELRRLLGVKVDDGDYVDREHVLGTALERELKDRLEEHTIMNLSGGGKHNLGLLSLDYTLAYSTASEDKPDECDPVFELDEDADLTLDLSDPDVPIYEITNLADGYEHDPANWEFDEVERAKNRTDQTDFMGSFNVKYPFGIAGINGEAKLGAKFRSAEKVRENDVVVYGWEGDDDITLDQFATGDITIFDGDYRVGPSPDSDKFREWFEEHQDGLLEGEIDYEASTAEDYTANETVLAWYAMSTLNMGKAMVLAGLRHEITGIDYTGYSVQWDEEGDYESTTEESQDDSYSNFLPMVHLRYQLNPQTNVRAAFTTGISRPNYFDLVPYKMIFREDEEMVIGNPALKPTTAMNIDLLAEHYFPGIGVASGGFFYKAMSDFIYTGYYEQSGGEFDGYEIEQKLNGESATLMGFEINWQQELSFLPSPLNGLGIYANYTYTNSEAEVAFEEGGDVRTIGLPGQAGNVGNFALAYEKYGFQGRLSLNYHGSYIEEVGDDEDEDIFYDDHLQLDFSASYQVTPMIQAYLEMINLTDAPLRYYMGEDDRPVQREYYSWWIHAGLKISL